MLRTLRPVCGFCSRAVTPISQAKTQQHATYKTWQMSDETIFTEDHEQITKTLSKIIEKDINPYVDTWEARKDFPIHQVMKTLGDTGLLGVNKPVEYGGLGLDYSFAIAVAEEMGSIKCGSIPMALGVQTDMATPALARFGSHELKEKFLAPSIRGDYVVCLGVSETGSGSDVASIKTKAVPDGDDLIINGEKMWITNSADADWMCLLASTNDSGPHTSKSLICMPMDLPGVSVVERIEKLGMHSSNSCRVVLENVRVPGANIIGDEGAGFMYQMMQFQEERLLTAAIERRDGTDFRVIDHRSVGLMVQSQPMSTRKAVAHTLSFSPSCGKTEGKEWEIVFINALKMMQRAIDETIEYTRDRKIFGGTVLDNQVVHFRMAELQTEVEMLRSLLYRAVGLYMKGNDVTPLASMLKLKTGRVSRVVADSCLQYWGGMGFADTTISRFYRDFRLGSIGGGADEVMLSILCKYMGILPKLKKSK